MSTNEELAVAVADGHTALAHNVDTPPGGLTDGADEVEAELQEMGAATDVLRKEGLITPAEAQDQKAEVERTRKLFRELKPEERAAIIRRRREIGQQIMNRQLAGAAVVPVKVRLNHTRLKPLFEQWWPFINRMSLNIQRFGASTFAKNELATIEGYLEAELEKLENYVDEQLRTAKGFREQRQGDMEKRGDFVFQPAVTRPSLEIGVEAYSRYSMRVLSVLSKFDQAMDQFDFMVWNGIRDQSDINEEVSRFLRKFHPLGVRSYQTHLKLMATVRGV